MSQPFLQLSATGCVVFGRHSAALASQTRQPGSQSRLPWDEAIAALAAQARFARGEDVLSYVKEAISQPQVLVFGELLDLAVVQELKSDPRFAPYFRLLEIFAFGTWQDYIKDKSALTLPDLSTPEANKLKQLSLVTMASGSTKTFSYSTLCEELQLGSHRELEDLVIAACDAGMLAAQLDPASELVRITMCMGRDVRDSAELEQIGATLTQWLLNIESAQAQLHDAAATEAQVLAAQGDDQATGAAEEASVDSRH